jgi:hypothetical protein
MDRHYIIWRPLFQKTLFEAIVKVETKIQIAQGGKFANLEQFEKSPAFRVSSR